MRIHTDQHTNQSSNVVRWHNLSQTVMDHSIQAPTQHQYGLKWLRWIRFTDQYFLQQQHPGIYLNGIDNAARILCLQSFLACMYFDDGLSPATIGNYLSAIRFHFERHHHDDSFLHPDNIARFMRGILLQEAAIGVQHDKKRPFPLSMIQSLIDNELIQNDLKDHPYRIAVILAYFFLLRQSEYIYSKSASNHAIRVQDVEFRVRSTGALIQSHQLSATSYRNPDIDLVKVTLRHCKNDPFRQGNSFWRERSSVADGEIDLVTEMVSFALLARSRTDDVFTSVRLGIEQTIHRVTYRRVMELIHNTAVRHRFPPNLFGSHSFRIAGATTLDAGLIPPETIRRIGAWRSSTTPMEYSQASTGAFNNAHQVLRNPNVFTEADLRLQVHTFNTRTGAIRDGINQPSTSNNI